MVEDLQQFPEAIPASSAGLSQEPPWALGAWIAWVLGPASLLGMLLFVWVTSGGNPMAADGFAVLGTAPLQVASLIMTFGMLISRGKFRRVPEFWFLVGYWMLLGGFLTERSGSTLFWKPAILCTACAFPIVGSLRLAVHGWRRRVKTTTV